jgi:16S rRNA processing protein RimM
LKLSNKPSSLSKSLSLGKIIKTHGLRGEVKVQLYNRHSEFLTTYRGKVELFPPHKDSLPMQATVLSVKPLSKSGCLLIQFRELLDSNSAQKRQNWVVKVQREKLPPLPPNEYWLEDLLGLTVTNAEGNVLGTVAGTYPTSVGEIVEIRSSNRESRWFYFSKQNLLDLIPAEGVFTILSSALLESVE